MLGCKAEDHQRINLLFEPFISQVESCMREIA